MTQLLADIKALSRGHPVLAQSKLDWRLRQLERMAGFYEAKAPESKDGGALFRGFASAILYSITIIHMYRKLTNSLAALAESETDEP